MAEAKMVFEQVPLGLIRKGIARGRIEMDGQRKKEEGTVVHGVPAEGLKYPEWQGMLQAALLELDGARLPARISAAEQAIAARLQFLAGQPQAAAEQQALNDAQSSLRILKLEVQRPA